MGNKEYSGNVAINIGSLMQLLCNVAILMPTMDSKDNIMRLSFLRISDNLQLYSSLVTDQIQEMGKADIDHGLPGGYRHG